MGTEAGVVRRGLEPAAPASGALQALTRRASLSALASLLDYAVKAGVTLVITPILVGGLGRSLYGVWEMLGRLVGYMSAADGRPTEALRLVVAQQQGAADHDINRRSVGAALTVWLLLLPVVLLVGAIITWFSPTIVNAPAESHTAVRLTSALLVVSSLLGGLGTVPESVLRGMNLGYKRMGLQAAVSIVWGALAAWAVYLGLGLAGLGGSLIARALITGVFFWLLVRKYVSWFRVARPTRPDVKRLLGMSVWLSAGDMIAKLLLASDVIILGAVVSPAAVTTFVLTGYAARTGLGIHMFTAGAAMPGFGGLLGERQLERAAQVRRELLTLTWLFVTAVGATVLAWNPSFLALWVHDGARLYAGPWVDLLIVLIIAQTAFIRTDAYIIDAALRPRRRVVIAAVTAVATLGLAIGLTHAFGILGLCLGMMVGRGIQSVAYPVIVHRSLERPAGPPGARLAAARLALTSALLLGAASWLGRELHVASWPVWLAGVVLTLALAVG
ncbi:MAG: oligosaccharide flippase family protein, partial [Gemmatimonadales bacterium]|nr:oligosaccharide flippase family protein [Gemmatimonadales bacterium]